MVRTQLSSPDTFLKGFGIFSHIVHPGAKPCKLAALERGCKSFGKLCGSVQMFFYRLRNLVLFAIVSDVVQKITTNLSSFVILYNLF